MPSLAVNPFLTELKGGHGIVNMCHCPSYCCCEQKGKTGTWRACTTVDLDKLQKGPSLWSLSLDEEYLNYHEERNPVSTGSEAQMAVVLLDHQHSMLTATGIQ